MQTAPNTAPWATRNYPESNDGLTLTAAELQALHRFIDRTEDSDDPRIIRAAAMTARRMMVACGMFPAGRKIRRILIDIDAGVLA